MTLFTYQSTNELLFKIEDIVTKLYNHAEAAALSIVHDRFQHNHDRARAKLMPLYLPLYKRNLRSRAINENMMTFL